jgi:ribonuclease HI
VHEIKTAPEGADISHIGSAQLFTDGSVKGPGRSFGGWGTYLLSETKSGDTKEFRRYGNLFNSDSFEAELKAVHMGIGNIKKPLHLEIITDSSMVIDGMVNYHEKKKPELERIENLPSDERLGAEWNALRHLNLLKSIMTDVNKNPNIASLTLSWVRSHTLDDECYLPNPKHSQDPHERRVMERCVGNFMADQQANLGAIKAVRSALWFLSNETNPAKLARSITTCRKNFNNSAFARNIAIDYLRSPSNNLDVDPEILQSVLSKETYEMATIKLTEEASTSFSPS